LLRLGIDVGGTFTDVAALDCTSGDIVRLKVPSTPREPERGVLAAFDALLRERNCDATAVEFLGHSTTIATNALLGQIGLELPRAALVTTHGFRDVIEIGRQNRSEIYDLFVRRPRPLVAREDRMTVRERIGSQGEIVEPLDEESLTRACAALRQRDDIAAVAVCLLNSYVNDAHERRVAAAIAQALPQAAVVLSSAVDPEYREYERFSTAVVSAVLAPFLARYLDALVVGLQQRGLRVPLYVMRSDGGLATAERATTQPAATIESGPAGGAIAAANLGRRIGARSLLAFDMGDTTAKAGAILDGIPRVAVEFEAAGKTHSGRAIKGSGYPVRYPFVDLAEVSAGGGTIAWVDDAGTLRVGPLSAGADPGPACYGYAEAATVTDANVVLGRCNPDFLLGGDFRIDAARARAAVAALAERTGLDVEATAAGIVTLVDAHMAKALRIVTLERGLDPRDFTLAAFGGGGPLHACALADDLGITRIVVPARPGIFSAEGLLLAELHERFAASVMRCLHETNAEEFERVFADWEAQGSDSLCRQGALAETLRFERAFDARYAGQSFELGIAYDASPTITARTFHAAHRARYGYDVPGEPIEIVNVRLTARAPVPSPPAPPRIAVARTAPASIAQRRVWHDGAFVTTPVYAREQLSEDSAFSGPAVIEQYDACTYLAPEWALRVDDDLLVMERSRESL